MQVQLVHDCVGIASAVIYVAIAIAITKLNLVYFILLHDCNDYVLCV